jgi:hypothetical protein
MKQLAARSKIVRIADASSAYVPVGRDAVADGSCVGTVKALLQSKVPE